MRIIFIQITPFAPFLPLPSTQFDIVDVIVLEIAQIVNNNLNIFINVFTSIFKDLNLKQP